MKAYDYDRQCWIDGEPARLLRLTQIADELALLTSPRRNEYARFIGVDATAHVTRLVAERSRLNPGQPWDLCPAR